VISQTQVTTLKLIAGQSHDFSVNVSDEESGNLIYAWDFDGDGISDGTGSSIIHSFDTKGSAWVRCIITNDAGLETQVDIQIQVISEGGETSSMSIVMIVGITTGAIGFLALMGFTIWRTLENRRISVLLAAAEAEETASKEVVQPSVNEQKAMWGGADSTQADAFNTQQLQPGGLSSGMSGLPIPPSSGEATHGAQTPVAEMDPDLAELISASPPPTNDAKSSEANNLLAAFEEDDAVPREEVEVNFDDDSVPPSEGIWQPPASEEFDLPSPPVEVAEDTIPIPVPPMDTIVENTIEKETESSPSIETETTDVLDAEQTPETEDENRTVRQSCSNCEKIFEVDMPKGVNAARTACPHCESVETVRLE
jgi:PKD repeat protein